MKKEKRFYVYAHKKALTGDIFYIGKGFGPRAYRTTHRNQYWNNIVNKYGFEVEIIKDGLTEQEAFKLEIELISKFKNQLCNLTNGGEGASGFSPTENCRKITGNRYKDKNLSEEHKKKISTAHKGKVLSKEHKKKLSMAAKGKPSHLKGKELTEAHKKKLSIAFSGANHPRFGKHVSKKTRNKISKSNSGKNNSMAKQVYIIDEYNNKIIFYTIYAASKYLKISTTSIRNYFKNKKIIKGKYFVNDIK